MVALHCLVFYHVSFTCWNWVPILAVNFFTKLGIEDSLKFAATEILTLKFGNPNLRVQQPPFSSHKGDQSFPLGTMRKMKAPLKQQHAHRNLAFHFRQCSRFCYVKREIKKPGGNKTNPKTRERKWKDSYSIKRTIVAKRLLGTVQKPKERKSSVHLSFRGVTTKA